ncbi:MAG: glycosyltransferase family 9 protein [Verrucomicrobia bacterium]|nr:glycosyltransferase family 9 protein [Verrucomicrobiota bacterium]
MAVGTMFGPLHSMPRVVKKNLCILFKYLGDVAVAVPAMRALKESRPTEELHILVAEEAVPIVRHLPWVTRVWGLPRTRGKAKLGRSFVGNDRGALLSLIIGAKERVGLITELGFWGRRRCYNRPVLEETIPSRNVHESERHLRLLEETGADQSASCLLELHPDAALAKEAMRLLEADSVVAHLSTSQPKKEWPVEYWRDLYVRAREAGVRLVFASGPSAREQALLEELRKIAPAAPVLERVSSLDLYLAVLARARAFISGDTGPLHFAAGLGVPTLSLFAATDARRWAPLGEQHRRLTGNGCFCSGHAHVCSHAEPCIRTLKVEAVWSELQSLLRASAPGPL